MPPIWGPRPRRLPRPIVEEELESLSHELGGLSLLGEKPGLEGACQRGSIDQFPILLDIEQVPRSATADSDTSISQPPSLVSESSRESFGPRTPPPVQYVPAPKQASDRHLNAPSYFYPPKPSTQFDRPLHRGIDQPVRQTQPRNYVPRVPHVEIPESRHPRVCSNQTYAAPASNLRSNPVNVQTTPVVRQPETGASRNRPTIAELLEEKLRLRREQKSPYPYDDRQLGENIQKQAAYISSAPPSPSGSLRTNVLPVQYISQPSSPSFRSATPYEEDRSYFPTTPVQVRTPSPRFSTNERMAYEPPKPQRAVSFIEKPHYRTADGPGAPALHRQTSDVPTTRLTVPVSPPRIKATRAAEPSTNLALRPCPRSYPVNGYRDWYTISGLEHLNICPSCMSQIGNSRFRDYFKPALNDSRTRIHCSFSEVWTRLAWIQTIKKSHDNLQLLYEITRPTGLSCPGRRLSMQGWHRVIDSETNSIVPKFAACSACVRNLQLLMPPLQQTFRPQTGLQEKICDLAVDSPRFVQYVDLLDAAANECEYERHKYLDNTKFIDYFERKCLLRDCRRQRPILGTWHYIPGLPEFTVCEDCYDDVVRPMAAAQKPIARRLATPPRLLPGSGPKRCREASCQLYSPRMRVKFRDAVLDNDYRMLESAALRRFDAEQRFNRKADELLLIPEKDRGYQWEEEWRQNLEEWKAYE